MFKSSLSYQLKQIQVSNLLIIKMNFSIRTNQSNLNVDTYALHMSLPIICHSVVVESAELPQNFAQNTFFYIMEHFMKKYVVVSYFSHKRRTFYTQL